MNLSPLSCADPGIFARVGGGVSRRDCQKTTTLTTFFLVLNLFYSFTEVSEGVQHFPGGGGTFPRGGGGGSKCKFL